MRQIKLFIHSMRAGRGSEPGDGAPSELAVKPRRRGYTAEKIFRWVKASRNLKQLRLIKDSRSDFIDLLEEIPEEFLDLAKRAPSVAYDVVRRGRVTLDLVNMNLMRSWWESLNVDDLMINIFMDASPQKRGYELFAVSADFCWRHSAEKFGYGKVSSYPFRCNCDANAIEQIRFGGPKKNCTT